MEFTNSFTVAAPLERVWSALTQIDDVAPCVPGAQITEKLSDDRFKGLLRIRLGAVQLSYRGEMTMEANQTTRTIVLQGKGAAQGQGNASGKVTVHVHEGDSGTDVSIVSEVDVTGRVATFGRGIMQDVANRMVREFSACLQQKLTSPGDAENPGGGTEGGTRTGNTPEAPGSATGIVVPETRTSRSTPSASSEAPSEVKMLDLLADVFRARVAEGLRSLANIIEPR